MKGGKQSLVLQQYWLFQSVQEKFAISSSQPYTEQLCHYLELFHEVMEVNFLLQSALTTSITENWSINLVLLIPPL